MRFQLEAKTPASLKHPQIAQIHGFEQLQRFSVLVTELVEGKVVADGIARGPMALDEALPIAQHIADVLQAAQEAPASSIVISGRSNWPKLQVVKNAGLRLWLLGLDSER